MKYLNNTKLDSLRIFSLSVLLISDPYLHAASQADVRREARAALNHLYSISHAVRHLGKSAKAVLVFPSIVKAGSLFWKITIPRAWLTGPQKINLNTTNHEIRRRKSVDSVSGIENCDDYDKISHYLHP